MLIVIIEWVLLIALTVNLLALTFAVFLIYRECFYLSFKKPSKLLSGNPFEDEEDEEDEEDSEPFLARYSRILTDYYDD